MEIDQNIDQSKKCKLNSKSTGIHINTWLTVENWPDFDNIVFLKTKNQKNKNIVYP